MSPGLLIRRLSLFARRHGGAGAAVALFVLALVLGTGSLRAGAEIFVNSLTPGMAAEAADEPARAAEGVAQLPLFHIANASRYAPQVLFPVSGHAMPLWLQLPRAKPAIAICVDDLGEDLAGTDKAMALPAEVALSFLPYAEATPFLAQEAEARGHAVLAHVPMEALSGTDPGAMALKVGAPDIAAKLEWNIARVPGLSGINNHEGSRFTQDEASLIPVVQGLAQKHLFFFDSRTGPDSKVILVARRLGVMTAGRDIFLDDNVNEGAVRAQLDALAAEVRRSGTAIAIGHPHDITLKVLAAWLKEDHGVELISLPEAMRRKSQVMAVAARD
jgi:polysaccharide deacetylase 2 family uncharacterized protein YibQ